jgi:twitching motility protein PilT
MNQVDPAPIAQYLAAINDAGGTDLHLTAGAAPLIRRDGVLTPIEGEPAFDALHLEGLITSLLGPTLAAQFSEGKEIDFAFDYGPEVRFRGNAFRQKGTVACALRRIPADIPSFEELGRRRSLRTWRVCRRASCSSPARPAPASRPRLPR